LKTAFKAATGIDWSPNVTLPQAPAPAPAVKTEATSGVDAASLDSKIREQGDKVRDLKTKKADKVSITKH
jgi:bifunctional glutamyl/prolyl-tRNA synthetase